MFHRTIVLGLHVVWYLVFLYHILKGEDGAKLVLQYGLQGMVDAPGLVHYQHAPRVLVTDRKLRFAIEACGKQYPDFLSPALGIFEV